MANMGDFMKRNENPTIHFNTGTVFDLLTGVFVLGRDGKYYCNGGIAALYYLIYGETNTYKTTLTNSLFTRMLGHYEDAILRLYDVENTNLDVARNVRMARFCPYGVEDRIYPSEHIFITDLLNQLIEIYEFRKKNKKDLMVETVFNNYKGEPIMAWMPFACILDSITDLKSADSLAFVKEQGLESSKLNKYFMDDGKRKTILVDAIKTIIAETGITFASIAHMGEKINLEMFPKQTKFMPFMSQNQTVKGSGSKSKFGAQVSYETKGYKPLLNPNDKTDYKYTHDGALMDHCEISMLVQKGKNNMSGTIFRFIMSQTNGLLCDLTNVDYVKGEKQKDAWGLNLSGPHGSNFCTILTPEMKSTRQTIIKDLDDSYELRRAYDLVAQLKYVVENYDKKLLPVNIEDMDINKMAEKLISSDSDMVKRILNSRGYWSYKEEEREYMSIIEVLKIFEKYKEA